MEKDKFLIRELYFLGFLSKNIILFTYFFIFKAIGGIK